jgi:hypothetical protein
MATADSSHLALRLVFDPQSNIFLEFENSCHGLALINPTDRGGLPMPTR